MTFLTAVRVEGFRGIGPTSTLQLNPGPGLALVLGGNGSGKSSFAEGLEILLTGSNWRWARRSKVWREGWRNLHQRERVNVRGSFTVEGKEAETVLTLSWTSEAPVDGERLSVRRPYTDSSDLDGLDWSSALEIYRPFHG